MSNVMSQAENLERIFFHWFEEHERLISDSEVRSVNCKQAGEIVEQLKDIKMKYLEAEIKKLDGDNDILKDRIQSMQSTPAETQPSLASFVDVNNPEEVKKLYIRLRDDIWEDTKECIGGHHDFLLEILDKCDKICSEKANAQKKDLLKAAFMKAETKKPVKGCFPSLFKSTKQKEAISGGMHWRQYKKEPGQHSALNQVHITLNQYEEDVADFCRAMAHLGVPMLIKEIREDVRLLPEYKALVNSQTKKEKINDFTTECIYLCWFITLQSPHWELQKEYEKYPTRFDIDTKICVRPSVFPALVKPRTCLVKGYVTTSVETRTSGQGDCTEVSTEIRTIGAHMQKEDITKAEPEYITTKNVDEDSDQTSTTRAENKGTISHLQNKDEKKSDAKNQKKQIGADKNGESVSPNKRLHISTVNVTNTESAPVKRTKEPTTGTNPLKKKNGQGTRV